LHSASHSRGLHAAVERRVVQGSLADQHGLAASWERCLTVHGLSPERMAKPPVLTAAEIKDRHAPLADLLALSQGELHRLFETLSPQDYVVMLSDAQGVALAFRSSDSVLDACSAAGVLPGSIWSEELQGTNGVGLCIQEQRPLSVVMHDHFATSLTGVSCTVAPIFGAAGHLAGVLDVTTLRASDRSSQAMALQLVAAAARRIENMYFARRNAAHAQLRFSRHGDFCDAAAEARLAFDGAGRILDATPAAQRLLVPHGESLLGQPLSQFPGLESWSRFVGEADTPVEFASGRFFFRVEEPRGRRATTTGATVARKKCDDDQRPTVSDIVGGDDEVLASVTIARRLVAHRVPIFLHGETGTGKSALARALHLDTGGLPERFVAINCAAIAPELIESELFGYRPGAFTGALRQGSRGRLLEADGGMLFLDEIGDMPLGLQTRLLQVLSEGEFVPVGAIQPVRVQFALVAASLHDLAQKVRTGHFREDLYFRLAGATVRLPALNRRTDRDALIQRMLAKAADEFGRARPTLQPTALRTLGAYAWPGNLRELQHVTRYAVAMAPDCSIGMEHLPPLAGVELNTTPSPSDSRRSLLESALKRSGWNVAGAAAELRISRATMHRQMRALNLSRPKKQD